MTGCNDSTLGLILWDSMRVLLSLLLGGFVSLQECLIGHHAVMRKRGMHYVC